MADNNDWVVEGAQVFTDHRGHLNVARIAKVTKRDIVMEDGTRFRRATLSRPLGSYDAILLRSINDPFAVKRFRIQRAGQAATAAATVLKNFASEPTPALAADVETAVEKWRAAVASAFGSESSHGHVEVVLR